MCACVNVRFPTCPLQDGFQTSKGVNCVCILEEKGTQIVNIYTSLFQPSTCRLQPSEYTLLLLLYGVIALNYREFHIVNVCLADEAFYYY